jgi:hypothetical protein
MQIRSIKINFWRTENIKCRKVTGGVCPPLTAFFSIGRNILFQISWGAYLEVHMHMPHLFRNRGCICTLCPTAPHASVMSMFATSLYVQMFYKKDK